MRFFESDVDATFFSPLFQMFAPALAAFMARVENLILTLIVRFFRLKPAKKFHDIRAFLLAVAFLVRFAAVISSHKARFRRERDQRNEGFFETNYKSQQEQGRFVREKIAEWRASVWNAWSLLALFRVWAVAIVGSAKAPVSRAHSKRFAPFYRAWCAVISS